MPWQQLIFTLNNPEYEPLSELLENRGALAISLSDAKDQPLYEPPPNTTPLWQQTLVTALFEANVDLNPIIASLKNLGFDQVTIQPLADQAWERVCLDQFKPQQFGNKLWICPSWHEVENDSALVVKLDPGLAFGTGSHATTRLCLTWLATHNLNHKTIIDYGCGSGILAISAHVCGAQQVYAVDIDPQALLATQQNAEQNAMTGCNISLPEQLPPTLQVDIVIANILALPLIDLAPKITALLKPGGQLVCSGILVDQQAQVQSAYQNHFNFDPPAQEEEWLLLTARKTTS